MPAESRTAKTTGEDTKRTEAQRMKNLGDEAAEILRRHRDGEIDGDEAAKQLYELRTRKRNLFDLIVG